MKRVQTSLASVWSVLVILGVFTLTACDDAEDTKAPGILSVQPAAQSAGVARNTRVIVTFDEEMEPASFDTETFKLVDANSGVGVRGRLQYSHKILSFLPDHPLQENATYDANVDTTWVAGGDRGDCTFGPRDLSGNCLQQPRTWRFATGAQIDTTPPTVVSVVPNSGEMASAVERTLVVTFSEAMDPSSVLGESVVLESLVPAERVDFTATWTNASTLTVVPSAPLAFSQTYRLTIASSARDLAGIALSSPFTTQFTTRGAEWVSSGVLELSDLGETTVDYPTQRLTARPGTSEILISWIQSYTASNRQIRLRTYDSFSNTFSDERPGPSVAGVTAMTTPRLAYLSSGALMCAWGSYEGSRYRVRASLSPDNGLTWSLPVIVDQHGSGSTELSQLLTLADGNALLLWRHDGGGYYSSQYTAQGNFWTTAPPYFSNGGGNPYNLTAGVDAQGNALATWVGVAAAGQSSGNLYSNRYVPGQGWKGVRSAEAISDNPGSFGEGFSQLVVLPSGAAFAAWVPYVTGVGVTPKIWVNRYNPLSDSWEGAKEVLTDGSPVGADLRLVRSGDNRAALAWSQGPYANSSPYNTRNTFVAELISDSSALHDWRITAPLAASREPFMSGTMQAISVDANRYVTLAWNQRREDDISGGAKWTTVATRFSLDNPGAGGGAKFFYRFPMKLEPPSIRLERTAGGAVLLTWLGTLQADDAFPVIWDIYGAVFR